jgi:membrane peptidoglycan carboxypeptidase
VSAIARLLLMAGLSGVLCSALVLPVVASTGILVRNTANKVTATALNVSALPQRSAMYDRDGHLITYFYGVDEGPGETYTGVDRQPVDYSQISPNMLKAIVAIEDDRYWSHGAIDFQGTLRAVVNDVEGQPVQGGSTIVQQYVKNELVLSALGNPTAEKAAVADNLSRKYSELRMALDVAQKMSKQDILAGYLNDAYFEQNAYGVEAAAETYFGTTADKLTLTQAALLAGMVENPSAYDPVLNPTTAIVRRNTVLARMMQTGVLSRAAEAKALTAPLGLHMGHGVQSGCSSPTVGDDGFFCDDVVHTILADKSFGATPADRARLLATGGLQIHTTVSAQDETAATNAVNYVMPQYSSTYNPAQNAATEAMVTPGTGQVMAIAEDRPYGTGAGQTEVDYAVNTQYGGQGGVQTGSSSKLFTLVTALEQGMPFSSTATVPYSGTFNGYTDCSGAAAGYNPDNGQNGSWSVVNSSSGDHGTYSLYTGTTDSINTFFANLELKVGLCNVVKTAVSMGMTRADGTSLLSGDGSAQPPADQVPSFTLGSVNVSPLSQADAYATVASGGIYCAPITMTSVTDSNGDSIPVPSAGCHRVMSSDVANGVNYILQGVLTTGTASPASGGPGVLSNGYPAAGKTGTSNVASFNGTPYAGFAGYTTNLASFTSVFNPISPTGKTMAGDSACYRLEFGGYECPEEMYGANAPASIWHMSFDHANLGHYRAFGTVSPSSELWNGGNGQTVVQPKPAKTTGTTPSPGTGGTGGPGGTGGGGAGGTGGGPGNGGPGNGGPGNGGPGKP